MKIEIVNTHQINNYTLVYANLKNDQTHGIASKYKN